jgi:hypothetical protein
MKNIAIAMTEQREPLCVSTEYWIEDEMGGHWSTTPPDQRSSLQALLESPRLVSLRIRLRFLRTVARRIGAFFSEPAAWSIRLEEAGLGESHRAWPQVCMQDMQRQLDRNLWVDDFDVQVWVQAWIAGAKWIESTGGNGSRE